MWKTRFALLLMLSLAGCGEYPSGSAADSPVYPSREDLSHLSDLELRPALLLGHRTIEDFRREPETETVAGRPTARTFAMWFDHGGPPEAQRQLVRSALLEWMDRRRTALEPLAPMSTARKWHQEWLGLSADVSARGRDELLAWTLGVVEEWYGPPV